VGHKDRANSCELRWRACGVVAQQEDQAVVGEQLAAGRCAVDD